MSVLRQNDELEMADRIGAALSGPPANVDAFLVSNSLWGGSGSVADQAGVSLGREVRRRIESALIDLGEAQLQEGLVNPRTSTWVEVFKQWRRDGI